MFSFIFVDKEMIVFSSHITPALTGHLVYQIATFIIIISLRTSILHDTVTSSIDYLIDYSFACFQHSITLVNNGLLLALTNRQVCRALNTLRQTPKQSENNDEMDL